MVIQSDSPVTLRALSGALKDQVPAARITVNNAYAVRSLTAKGTYETRVMLTNEEIRTTFLPKEGNPLSDLQQLARTGLNEGELGFNEHVSAIRANEQKLPLINKEVNCSTGDELVTILPFGHAPNAPAIYARTSFATNITSLEVKNASEMSPAEAKLVGEALVRASQLAGRDKSED